MAALTFDDIDEVPKSRALTFDDVQTSVKGIDSPEGFGNAYADNFKNYATNIGEQYTKPYERDNTAGPEWLKRIGDFGGRVGNIGAGVLGATVLAPIEAGFETQVTQPVFRQFVDPNTTFEQKQKLAQGAKDTADLLSQAVLVPTKMGPQGDISNVKPSAISAIKDAVPIVSDRVGALEDASLNLPSILGDTRSGVTKMAQPKPYSLQDVKGKAEEFYNSDNGKSAQLNDKAVSRAIEKANKDAGYQSEEGLDFAGNNIVTETLNALSRRQGKPLSLKGLQEIDDELQGRIGTAIRGGDNTSASKLMDIRDALRGAANEAKESDVTNPAAFQNWRTGDALYSAYRKMKEQQGILDNANLTDNPVSAIKTGYRNLYKRLQKNHAGYNDEEIEAIKHAATTGIVTGALRTMGSRLISGVAGGAGGAAGGGIPGAIAGVAAGEAVAYPMRSLANSRQMARGQRAMDMVGNRPAVKEAFTNGPAQNRPVVISGLLPAPKTVVSVDSLGRATQPLSAAGREALGRQAPSNKLATLIAQRTPQEQASFAKVWDEIDGQMQAKINADIERAYNGEKMSLSEMINNSRTATNELSKIIGGVTNPAMKEALVEATREPTLKEIMNMKPSDARKAMDRARGAGRIIYVKK